MWSASLLDAGRSSDEKDVIKVPDNKVTMSDPGGDWVSASHPQGTIKGVISKIHWKSSKML